VRGAALLAEPPGRDCVDGDVLELLVGEHVLGLLFLVEQGLEVTRPVGRRAPREQGSRGERRDDAPPPASVSRRHAASMTQRPVSTGNPRCGHPRRPAGRPRPRPAARVRPAPGGPPRGRPRNRRRRRAPAPTSVRGGAGRGRAAARARTWAPRREPADARAGGRADGPRSGTGVTGRAPQARAEPARRRRAAPGAPQARARRAPWVPRRARASDVPGRRTAGGTTAAATRRAPPRTGRQRPPRRTGTRRRPTGTEIGRASC